MMTTVASLEERLVTMETQLSEMKRLMEERFPELSIPPKKRGIPAIIGTFENDSAYEEAMRLGREWRDSQRIEDEDE